MNTTEAHPNKSRYDYNLYNRRYIERCESKGLYQRVLRFSPDHLEAINDYASANGLASIGESISELIRAYKEAFGNLDESTVQTVAEKAVADKHKQKLTSLYLGIDDFIYLQHLSRSANLRKSASTGIALLVESLKTTGLV